MLRTIFVIVAILVGILYSFKGAFYTLLFYLWIAYFRPDTWLWSNWVTQLNLSFIVGITVVVSTLMSKDRIRFEINQLLMVAFLMLGAASTFFSEVPAGIDLWPAWMNFARVIIMSLAIVTLVTTEERLKLTLLVIAASLALEGAKQGWAQLILNPGAANANQSAFLGDNNGVAVGMLMLVPILAAIAATSPRRWMRWAVGLVIIGVVYRAISTYSRGGFLAAGVLVVLFLLRTKKKLRALIVVGVLAVVVVPVLPSEFWERMGTIGTAAQADDQSELETSAAGRIHFWRVAVEMANDRPFLGVGFNAYNHVYDRYDFSDARYGKGRSVHSAWFGLLAELGYLGLAIFVWLFLRALLVNWRARRAARSRPDLENLAIYGTALESALAVFAVGGAFVPYQYNEMVWHFLALTIVVDRLVRNRLSVPATSREIVSNGRQMKDVRLGISGRRLAT